MSDWPVILPDPTLEMEFIGTTTLAAPAASISVSVPASVMGGSYLTFEAVAYVLKDGSNGNIAATLNNDGGANYNFSAFAYAGGFVATNSTAQTSFLLTQGVQLANETALYYLQINKPVAGEEGSIVVHGGLSGATVEENSVTGAEWANTADLITRFDVISQTANMATGSRLSMGGGRAA